MRRLVGFLGLAVLSFCPACSLVVDDLRVAADAGAVDLARDLSVPDLSHIDMAVSLDAAEPDLAGPTCDPSESVDLDGGVFVSAQSGSPQGSGGAASPLSQISAAITVASQGNRAVIYLDEGSYGEFLDVFDAPAGITLSAGWNAQGNGAWSRDCGDGVRGRTVIQSPTTIGMRASGVVSGGGFQMQHLSIANTPEKTTPMDTAGASRVGLFVRGAGSLVTLLDVAVDSSNADDGGPASLAAPGAAPSCTSSTTCLAGTMGTQGVDGADVTTAGTFSPTGYVVSDGQAGQSVGGDGQNGTPGDPVLQMTGCVAVCGCANNCVALDNQTVTVGPGQCGCGGHGGAPGKPGRSGGASVGILASGVGTTVRISYGQVSSGAGGDGSAGGPGGAGSSGTMGKDSATGICHAGTCIATRDNNQACLTCANSDGTGAVVAARKRGGPGGAGGTGGDGGAGAGGPSVAVVTINGAQLMTDQATVLTPGPGGHGGGGQALDGASMQRVIQP